MTVLPNAPIDADTGLPVPTIAVATDGGVSVIKDDGTVVDITASAGASYNGVGFISFDSNHNMIFEQDSIGRSLFYMPIPSADTTSSTSSAGSTDKKMLPFSSPNTTFPKFNGSNATLGIGGSGEDQYIHGGTGVTHYAQGPSDANSSVAYIASDYNTGWMHGDIKLATLSDTDDTDISGGNEITNGDAWSGASSSQSSTAPTGWTGEGGATWSTETGGDGSYIRLYNENNGGAGPNSYMHQTITTVVGKKYTISATQYHHATITVYVSAGTGAGAGNLLYISYVSSSGATPKEVQGTFTATGTTTYINLGIISGTHNYSVGWDNIVVTESEEDRSVNNKGLQVFGTITKTAVATGAELVGYSGFSASNYLQHTASTNYGSPAVISFMGWQKVSDISNYQYMASLIDGTSGNLFGMSVNSSATGADAGKPYFYDSVNSSLQATTRVDDGTWHFMVGVFDGTSKKLYIDGKLNASATVTALAMTNVTNTNVGFYVPTIGGTKQYFHLGSIALIRISATAPTDEQVAKIYNDEKFLFQDNAKATLYGSSDAVTALAYDDDTELLHVGTSAGRSVFQGLNRVDNTTDAVGTSISASNGFIVED